jgi:template-activating factor I
MSHPPAFKQQKIDPEDAGEDFDESLRSLETIQDEIEKLNDEATEEILQVERKYNGKRRPYYKRRNEIIREIPGFWLKVFTSHEMLTALLDENDQAVFKYLKELNVEDHDDVKSGYKISLTFDPNPFFKNSVLSKEFRYDKDGNLTVVPTPIDWKDGKDLTKKPPAKDSKGKRQREDESESFFTWFSPEDQDLELAEIIKEELWPNPGKFFLGLAEEEDLEEAEEEGGEEVEGEVEGEGEEAEDGAEEEGEEGAEEEEDNQ